jgi:hypothetical protein
MRLGCLLLLFSLVIMTGCKKDHIKSGPHLSTTYPPREFAVSPLRDITHFLPNRTVNLFFKYVTNYHPEISIEWKKISGPAEGYINNTHEKETQIVDLVKGTYHIALHVTNSYGVQHRDTMIIEVVDPGDLKNEKIFDDLHWVSPMGSTAEVIAPEIFSSGNPILVFAQMVNGWDTVPPIQSYEAGLPYPYYYQRYENHIVMYSELVPWFDLTSAIKVIY